MGTIGSEAKVQSSTGTYSRKFVGRTGTVVSCLNSTGTKYWVLRFPSVLWLMEEGLFADGELNWINELEVAPCKFRTLK